MKLKDIMTVLMASSMVITIFSGIEMPAARGEDGDFGGGDGSSGDPYVIEDVWDLQNMSSNLSAHYVLKNDINASATASWNSGAGFAPIGTENNKFTGSLDGKNHTVNGLFINRSGTDYVGLFGYVDADSLVKNIGILNCTITGNNSVGGLVGRNYQGQVSDCFATGNVAGTKHRVGGLVGYNSYGSVNNSYAKGNVTGTESHYVGGLMGYNEFGTVSNSYSSGKVAGAFYIGGLEGYSKCRNMSNSYSTGNVTGISYVGGVVGLCYLGTLSECYATGDINGSSSVGGLVGEKEEGTVSKCYAYGKVNGSSYYVGGLVGYNDEGTVDNSYSIGDVTGADYVGGLVGSTFSGSVNNSYATGNVNGTGSDVGGLVGKNSGKVSYSYSTGIVSGIDDNVGGLVGSNGGSVNNSYSTGNVTGAEYVGGLVGSNYGTVSNSYSTGIVSGTGNHDGGLVGSNSGTVSSSYSSGNTNGADCVGGLMGSNSGTVNNSYSIGNVKGGNKVGGLVGSNAATVKNSYCTGSVNGTGKTGSVGGLVGINSYGSVNNSYATGNVSGKDDYVGGLVGHNYYGSVNNTYARGNVTGSEWWIGGLIGRNKNGTVSISYSTGNVTGNGWVGGLVGEDNDGTVSKCFWDNETSGLNSSDGGTGKSTLDMKTRKTFTGAGWNFKATWCIEDNVTYPLLKWQDGGYPYVDAGTDQTVENGTLVSFNGSLSSDAAGIVNYTWKFMDGAAVTLYGVAPTYLFQRYDVFLVTLTVRNTVGNKDMDTVTITVKDITAPVAGAGSDKVVDEDALTTFDGSGSSDNVGIVNYTWNFTDGAPVRLYGVSPTYTFKNPGKFIVMLNVSDNLGNWDTDTMTVTVRDVTRPSANAGLNQTVDEDVQMTFDGTGSSDNVGIINYTWNFTDGTPVTLYGVKPIYTFNNPGIFVVILNVSDAAGNWYTDTMQVTVKDITRPSANAGSDQVIDEDVLTTFNGSGSSDNVGVVNYTWTFRDAIPVVLYGMNPEYHFENPGTFVVTLKVTDAAGFWATDDVIIIVKDITLPFAEAGPDRTIDEGALLWFNARACGDNVGVVNYTWTFEDVIPVVLYGMDPKYRFENPGIFVVTLNVSDAAGNWASDTFSVTVNDVTDPIVDAGPDRIVDEDLLLTFNASASSDNVGIVNFTWRFLDGEPVMLFGPNPSYQFKNPGMFIVRLDIMDAAGNNASDSLTVIVRDTTPPVADAGQDRTVDEGTSVVFNGTGSIDNAGVVNYTWTFQDGGSITLYGAEPSHRFNNPGLFAVILEVSDIAGHVANDTFLLTVRDITPPVANAGPDMIIAEIVVTVFDGIGSSDNVDIVNYTWTFEYQSGPVVLFGISQSFVFSIPGVYSITLKVTDAAGLSSEDTMTLTVRDITRPVAVAGSDRTVPAGSTVAFDGSLSTDNMKIDRFFWNFMYDGMARSLEGSNVSFTFGKGGVYEVVLTVVDLAGNIGKDSVVITVVGTGRVYGTVVDRAGRPVEGATVEISSSNGTVHSATTGADGTFSVEVYFGSFNWRVIKKGYVTISGASSVKPMDDVRLDLSGSPLARVEGKEPVGGPIIPVLVAAIAIAAIAGAGGYLVWRRRRGKKGAGAPSPDMAG